MHYLTGLQGNTDSPRADERQKYNQLLKSESFLFFFFKHTEILSSKALHDLTLCKCSIVGKTLNDLVEYVCFRTFLWFSGISFATKLWAALHTLLLLVTQLCNK